MPLTKMGNQGKNAIGKFFRAAPPRVQQEWAADITSQPQENKQNCLRPTSPSLSLSRSQETTSVRLILL